jgi:hypothetical protein
MRQIIAFGAILLSCQWWASASTTVPTTTYSTGGTVAVIDSTTIQTGSGATVIVSPGASVSYEAGTSVTLNPGFDAKPGSFFDALPNSDATPDQPAGLSATSQSTSYINLLWFPSTDTTGGIYYKIYRNGTPVGTSYLPVFTDNSVSSGTTYAYTVKAFDSSGNSSAISAPLAASATTGVSVTELLGLGSTPTAVAASSLSFVLLRPQ